MLVGDLLMRTCNQTEGFTAPGQWSRELYLHGMDSAALAACLLLNCTPAWLPALPVAEGQNLLTMPATPYKVMAVRDAVTKKILLNSSEALENGLNPAWRETTGTPTGWVSESANTVRLNRKVPTAKSYEIQVIEAPQAMVDDADPVDPRIPPFALKALHLGAAAFLLRQAGDRQDLQTAEHLEQKFLAALGVTNG